MPPKLQEITLTFEYERVRFDNSNVAILDCCQESEHGVALPTQVTVKTECEPGEMVIGLPYRFYGRWSSHPKYGKQFHAKTFVKQTPHRRAGVIRYLLQAPHIGRQTAIKLWEKFQGDAVRIAREQPDVAAAAVGGQFSDKRAVEAAGFLKRDAEISETTIDLMDLFDGRGFPKSLGKRAVAEWGNKAAELVRRNPYLLMRFHGVGFLGCDKMFMDLGGDPKRLKRQALCAWHSIARDTNGSTWFQPTVVERGLRERIAGADVHPVPAVRLAVRAGILHSRRDGDGKLWLAESRNAKNEQAVANRVTTWLNEPSRWPSVAGLDVSDHQQDVIYEALQAPLAIFTGGPGSGKTYCAARIVKKLLERHGGGAVAVAAPTGKAAVRITEAMQRYRVDIRARTIHSLLGVESHSEGDGWAFKHNETTPLPFRYIVVDETSMVDAGLCASLFKACAAGTHVLLVGDTGQLPPVGHGAPLRDLIAAGVPTGQLIEIRRHSGAIVAACHQIREGKQFRVPARFDPNTGDNLKLLPAVNSEAALERIVQAIRSIAGRRLADPIWDIQVIVAVNARSKLSRRDVNLRLQNELNAGGHRANGNPFRTSDKIVNLKNGFFPVVDDAPEGFNEEVADGKVFVANGEQAAVKHVGPNLTIAQLDAPARLIKIPRGNQQDEGSGSQDGNSESTSTGCSWDLAYAISCHKSQGSEWPIVMVALDDYAGARMVCSREWIYTAISRAKRVGFLVGKISVAHGMVQREAISKRKTFLKELICE